MNAPPRPMGSIREALADARANLGDRRIWGASAGARIADACAATCLDRRADALADRSVLVATRDQFAAALALIELDGVGWRLILATPDVTRDRLASLADRAGADAIVTDGDRDVPGAAVPVHVCCACAAPPAIHLRPARCETEWVLLTSGTTAAAKMGRHTFSPLTGAVAAPAEPASNIVWGTFYDIRRYGGLQVLLRALVGGASFVVGGPDETAGRYLERLAAHGA